MKTQTPVNQVRLTNVAYVRLNKGGKRFEIACYRNKVINYRNKVETDLDEVLQIDNVFTNVSKGMIASKQDLLDVFGNADQKAVCKEILDHGELQVSEQERQALQESMFRDVASIVTEKAVNPTNNRPYTISMIQNAMRQIHFSVNLSKSAKQQALEVIRKLKDVMPIARAQMQLRVICPLTDYAVVKQEIQGQLAVPVLFEGIVGSSAVPNNLSKDSDQLVIPMADLSLLSNTDTPSSSINDTSNNREVLLSDQSSSENNVTVIGSIEYRMMDIRVDPDVYRKVEQLVTKLTTGRGRVDILQMAVAAPATQGAANGVTSLPLPPPPSTSRTGGKKIDVADTEELPVKVEKKTLGKNTSGPVIPVPVILEGSDEEEAEDDGQQADLIIGPASKKKKDKKKAKRQQRQQTDSIADRDDTDEEDAERETEHQKLLCDAKDITLASTSNVSSSAVAAGSSVNKVSKKNKRVQKEEQAERDKKLEERKARLEAEAAVVAAAAFAAASSATINEDRLKPDAAVAAGKLSCNTCTGGFPDAAAFRLHFKSEWHRYNLKRKLKGLSLVTSEEAFKNLPPEEIEL